MGTAELMSIQSLVESPAQEADSSALEGMVPSIVRRDLQALLSSAPLAVADVAALGMATLAATTAAQFLWPQLAPALLTLLAPLSMAALVVYTLFGLYPGIGLNPVVELRQLSVATSLIFAGFAIGNLIPDHGSWMTESVLAVTWLSSLILLPLARAAARSLCADASWWSQPVLIFGGGAAAAKVYASLKSNPRLGLRPLGCLEEAEMLDTDLHNQAYLGEPRLAPALARRYRVSWAVIAMPDRPQSDVLRMAREHAAGIPHLLIVPDMAGLPSLWNRAHDCAGLPGIQVKERLLERVPRIIKRAMDMALSLAVVIAIAPLFLLIAAMNKITSPGPIFYCQQRIGVNGRRFFAWKFRTMVPQAERVLQEYLAANPQYKAEWQRDHKLKNDPRITQIGRFLRKTSLDELPQIWNVLCGEMSLVGPRPIVEAEIAKYADRFELYTKVRPGITGLWQVSGRNDTTYAERVDLDSYYVRNWSPWLDLHILARTIKVVLFRDGAY